jgi:outer membrane protein
MFGKFITATALAAAMLSAAPAFAEAGDILVRARIVTVAPTDGGRNGGILPSVPTGTVNVSEAYIPEIDLTYFFTDNIALETICCAARHTIRGDGAVAGLGAIGKTWVTPFTFNIQYHFDAGGFKPYVGVGPTVTLFYGENETTSLRGALGQNVKLNVKDKVGVDFQVGVDIPITDRMFFNADFKYYLLRPTAELTGGAVPTQTVKVKLDPIIAGIGIGWKF